MMRALTLSRDERLSGSHRWAALLAFAAALSATPYARGATDVWM